jgi:hypothetical protein
MWANKPYELEDAAQPVFLPVTEVKKRFFRPNRSGPSPLRAV